MAASIIASTAACWPVKNEQSSASSSRLILPRIEPRASWARVLGSRCPAASASSMSRPDTPWMSEITEDSFRCPSSRSFPRPLLFGGAGLGEVTAVAGVGAEPADRLGRHEAGADHAPLGDLGEPDRVGPVGFGPARQRLDLPGVIQLAVQPLRFQQEEHRLPVVTGG